jgi:hypothetical protein
VTIGTDKIQQEQGELLCFLAFAYSKLHDNLTNPSQSDVCTEPNAPNLTGLLPTSNGINQRIAVTRPSTVASSTAPSATTTKNPHLRLCENALWTNYVDYKIRYHLESVKLICSICNVAMCLCLTTIEFMSLRMHEK